MHILVKDENDLVTAFPLEKTTLRQGAYLNERQFYYDNRRNKLMVETNLATVIKEAWEDENICSVKVPKYYNVIDMPLAELFERVAEAQNNGEVVLDLTEESGSKAYEQCLAPPSRPSLPSSQP